MPDKTVTVNVDCSTTPPTFTFSGDVAPGDSEIVDIDGDSIETVTWNLTASNNNGAVAFAQDDPIVFAGGQEDSWANDGEAPPLTRVSDTEVTMTDNNSAQHNGVLVHYYKINIVYNGVGYTKDPEVDEMTP